MYIALYLWINKGNHYVTSSLRGGQSFMVVSQPSRMNEHPALSRRSDAAVVADKPTTSTLKTMCVQSIKIKFGKICVILKRW